MDFPTEAMRGEDRLGGVQVSSMMQAMGWMRTILPPSMSPEEAGCLLFGGMLGGAPSPQLRSASLVEMVERCTSPCPFLVRAKREGG